MLLVLDEVEQKLHLPMGSSDDLARPRRRMADKADGDYTERLPVGGEWTGPAERRPHRRPDRRCCRRGGAQGDVDSPAGRRPRPPFGVPRRDARQRPCWPPARVDGRSPRRCAQRRPMEDCGSRRTRPARRSTPSSTWSGAREHERCVNANGRGPRFRPSAGWSSFKSRVSPSRSITTPSGHRFATVQLRTLMQPGGGSSCARLRLCGRGCDPAFPQSAGPTSRTGGIAR